MEDTHYLLSPQLAGISQLRAQQVMGIFHFQSGNTNMGNLDNEPAQDCKHGETK